MTVQVIALHTRLTPGNEDAYDRVHEVIPDALDRELRNAGVRSWRIWRHGLDVFHVVEVDDFAGMEEHLHALAVQAEWERTINPLLDLEASRDGPLNLVWQLPTERPGELP